MRAILVAIFIAHVFAHNHPKSHKSKKGFVIKTKKGKSYLVGSAGGKHKGKKAEYASDYALG